MLNLITSAKTLFPSNATFTGSQRTNLFGGPPFKLLRPRSCLCQSQLMAQTLPPLTLLSLSFPLHSNTAVLFGLALLLRDRCSSLLTCPIFISSSHSLHCSRGDFSNPQITPYHSCIRHFKRTSPISLVWCLRP